MQNDAYSSTRPQFGGLFKAVLVIAGLYYVLFAGLGFGKDAELRQFLDDAANRPATETTDSPQPSG